MLHPELRRRAFLRSENEVRLLAEQDSYMREELEVLRRRNRMSFYSDISPTWLMEHGERAALVMLVSLVKPKVIIEIGTRFAGSALLFANHAERVICIDIDNAVRARCQDIPNIEVVIGNSAEKVPEILSNLRSQGLDFDLALIDGDHSHEGVKRDIEAFLAVRPTRTQWLILHDTFNPIVRNGIRAVNWNVPWVHEVEIDFVPGNLMSNPHVRRQMWGGIGIAELRPADRQSPIQVEETHRLLYEASYRSSSYVPPRILERVARRAKRAIGLSGR